MMNLPADATLERRRHRAVALLALNSGATDALGFLGLGGAFTSVMTGNMVLTGVGAATADVQLTVLAVGAIVSFCVGCALGAKIAGPPRSGDHVWPPGVTIALTVQLAITAAFAAGWWITAAAPDESAALAFLGLNALGLGIQSSAVQRFGVPGLSTTYLTGTLTTFVVNIALRRQTNTLRRNADILAALILGAALGALLIRYAPMTAPGLQLACLAVVLTASVVGLREPKGSSGQQQAQAASASRSNTADF